MTPLEKLATTGAMIDPTTTSDSLFMRAALEQAACAAALAEVPIGAVLVHQGAVVAQAHNFRERWQDPTAHAETIVIREAAKALGRWRLTNTTLYVTLEPCAMCLGAVILARIPRLVFAAKDPKAGACGSVLDFASHPRLNHRVTVLGGILEGESQRMLTDFFQAIRAQDVDPETL
ncbi:MAG TPA: tRNA adenosine(34) deaminase TadA [Nitrospiraceae bacterium]|nr:tRNA adenosine(34) deaminase TadA [Nitrospiraceae bacterium]